MGYPKDLPISNVLYAYVTLYGINNILDHNNNIYMGDHMEDSLSNTLKSEDNGVHLEIRPK